MKIRHVVVAVVVVVAGGCGSSNKSQSAATNPCDGNVLLGSWTGSIANHPDTMAFGSDCKGSSSYCQSSFTFPQLTSPSGSVLISNVATNGAPGCLPAGNFTCAYQVSASTLSFTCGGTVLTYAKQ